MRLFIRSSVTVSESFVEAAVREHGAARVFELLKHARGDLRYDWEALARPEQLLPELHPDTGRPWHVALLLAGRGAGKTRVGAEWTRKACRSFKEVNLIGATADDARDIMIEGESGILAVCPEGERPIYRKSDRCLVWPSGCKSLIFTADEPDRLRGKQHEKVWADEVGAWRYEEAWDQMLFGLRLGSCPQVVATTTPRNRPLIKTLLRDRDCYVVRGSTYDNAHNLAPTFVAKIREKYEGTRLGRQEIYAEVLDDVPGALWHRMDIDATRVKAETVFLHDMRRVVVAIDPSGGAGEDSDEQGIVVVALSRVDGHAYVLADLSCRLSPDGWGRRAIDAYIEYKADRIVYERNFGGDMVEHVLRTAGRNQGVLVATKAVTASRGKMLRAEPIAALYEQKRVHHIGALPTLEDQMCAYAPSGYDGSPDRLDALVWALTDLMLGAQTPSIMGLERYDAGKRRW